MRADPALRCFRRAIGHALLRFGSGVPTPNPGPSSKSDRPNPPGCFAPHLPDRSRVEPATPSNTCPRTPVRVVGLARRARAGAPHLVTPASGLDKDKARMNTQSRVHRLNYYFAIILDLHLLSVNFDDINNKLCNTWQFISIISRSTQNIKYRASIGIMRELYVCNSCPGFGGNDTNVNLGHYSTRPFTIYMPFAQATITGHDDQSFTC